MRTFIALPFLLAACWLPPREPDSHTAECNYRLEGPILQELDVLFVVDDGDLDPTARGLVAAKLQGFVRGPWDGPTSVHVGAVSSDPAEGARLWPVARGRRYLDWHSWSGEGNLPAGVELPGATSHLVESVVPAAPSHQPLEMAYHALHDNIAENQGFLRADSDLIVVFVATHDDDGTETLLKYQQFFGAPATMGGVRFNPRRVWLAAITGPCAGPIAADDAPRIQAVVTSVDGHGAARLCDDTYYRAEIPGAIIDRAPLCLVRPPLPGPNPCVVQDVSEYPERVTIELPRCGDGVAPPCYRFSTSPDCPRVADQTEPINTVVVDRGPDMFQPPGSFTRISCECDPTTSSGLE